MGIFQPSRGIMCAGLALAFLLVAPPLLAETAPAADNAQADAAALFKEGTKLYSQEGFEESYEAYRRAWEQRPSYDIAGNLGNVEMKLGKHTAAIGHLDYARANLPPSLSAERRTAVIEMINARRAEALGHVATVKIVSDPPGAQLTVDKVLVGVTPIDEVYLDPGEHHVSVSLGGYVDDTQRSTPKLAPATRCRLPSPPSQRWTAQLPQKMPAMNAA